MHFRLTRSLFYFFVCALSCVASAREAAKSLPPQVDQINRRVQAVWTDFEITPSKTATDEEFCRRLFLDILGRIPTESEAQQFAVSRDANKNAELVHELLYEKEYAQDYIRNWSTIWTNILIGRTGGQERNSVTSRRGMQIYLRACFATNKPYDTMVHELISATGDSSPNSENFNGAVNFLCGKLDEKASQATAHTSRIFLGLQVQCTQCHNHPFNEWKQNQYWQMNSFFRQTVALRRFQSGTNDVSYVQLTDQDFAGEDRPLRPEEGRIFYELRNGKLEAAIPKFVDGTTINPSGYLSDINRRAKLAALVTKSDLLPLAIANRMWAHFLGYGFTKPIDDMGPHNAPSHPELLDYLGREFRTHSYDLKQLMSWIALSEAYSLSSRMTAENAMDDPTLGESPKFSHFYVRQMTAEQLYESLLVATRADAAGDKSNEKREQTRQEWLDQFSKAFGTDEGDESTTFDGTIPQTLMMFNGDLIKKATDASRGSFLHSVLETDEKFTRKVNQLYLAAFSRMPTRQERKSVEQLRQLSKWNEKDTLQDLWWALLNSNEFILNH
ncbi:MAG: DUF1549 domain-containing protein [Planctomycetales bacterium]|nr:DUF1549 domain-containing protein [Planctomycetales bacterium]